MKYILLILVLSGCVKDPCLMHDSKGDPYLVSKDGKVAKTNGLSELVYERCNP